MYLGIFTFELAFHQCSRKIVLHYSRESKFKNRGMFCIYEKCLFQFLFPFLFPCVFEANLRNEEFGQIAQYYKFIKSNTIR